MTTIDQFRTAAPAPASLLAGLAARFQAWSERRATARALASLSDHQLDDLGLARADIVDIANGRRPARRV